jgi:hypothetical protein
MAKSGFQNIKKTAGQQLNSAAEELSKVRFDPFKTCGGCRESMINHLSAYLIKNGVQPKPLQTISILMEQCKSINPDFENLDLSSINCKYELVNVDPCTTRDKLEDCYHSADQVKTFVSTT